MRASIDWITLMNSFEQTLSEEHFRIFNTIKNNVIDWFEDTQNPYIHPSEPRQLKNKKVKKLIEKSICFISDFNDSLFNKDSLIGFIIDDTFGFFVDLCNGDGDGLFHHIQISKVLSAVQALEFKKEIEKKDEKIIKTIKSEFFFKSR